MLGSPKGRSLAGMALVLGLGLGSVSCVDSGGDSYEEFLSAVEGKADCRELFDQRDNFDEAKDLDRIDKKLDEIGCDSPTSDRSDL